MTVGQNNQPETWPPGVSEEAFARDVPLAPMTWFRVGGPAKYFCRPKTIGELSKLLSRLPRHVPHIPIGVGSNILVRDGGVDGVLIRLGGEFTRIKVEADYRIRAGAAALDVAVAREAGRHDIGGLEFLRGIPGTIGGALRMNAGAYGRETKDVLIEAAAIDRTGTLHRLGVDDLDYGYRTCGADPDLVFVEAVFQGSPGVSADIVAKMDEITKARESTQPIKSRTGGSTFKNPPFEESKGRRAWELIDEAGCRGLRVGGAQVSEQHCNFLINLGEATAEDLENLGEQVRQRVLDTTSVELQWEIKRLGQGASNG